MKLTNIFVKYVEQCTKRKEDSRESFLIHFRIFFDKTLNTANTIEAVGYPVRTMRLDVIAAKNGLNEINEVWSKYFWFAVINDNGKKRKAEKMKKCTYTGLHLLLL